MDQFRWVHMEVSEQAAIHPPLTLQQADLCVKLPKNKNVFVLLR